MTLFSILESGGSQTRGTSRSLARSSGTSTPGDQCADRTFQRGLVGIIADGAVKPVIGALPSLLDPRARILNARATPSSIST